MDKVAVSVPTLTGRLLIGCVESVVRQDGVFAEVIIVRNGAASEALCAELERRYPSAVSVYRSGENMGVAASWNLASRWAWDKGYNSIVHMNDDIRLTEPTTLKIFADAAAENPQRLILSQHGFSAFCWTRWMSDTLGLFDEGFWPAYFEDKDMLRRVTLKGIAGYATPSCMHHQGSDTIHQGGSPVVDLHRKAFPLNEKRYYAKWGGGLGHETYMEPWGGLPPVESTKILIARRG